MSRKLVALLLAVAMLACAGVGLADAPEAPITFPYTGEEVIFTAFGYDGLNQDPTLPVMQAWQEHIGNIKVQYEFVSRTDWNEKHLLMLSTGDMPDILPVNNLGGKITQYGPSGILLDFNQYIDYMPNLQNYLVDYPNLNFLCTASGARYGIVGVQPLDRAGEAWFANMTVLREAGIEEAPDTFEDLIAAMRAVKEKGIDAYPYISYMDYNYTIYWLASAMLGCDNHGGQYGISLVFYDKDSGKYQFHYRGEAAEQRRQVIELVHNLYAEGLLHPELATISVEQVQSLIAQGKWAFTTMYYGSIEKECAKLQAGEALPFEVQVILPPASEEGERVMPLNYVHDGVPGWGIVCSAATEHPELLAAYMDQVVSPAGRDNFNYGIEGQTYDVIDGIPVMREGIDPAEWGIRSQYEVWMVGMGKPVQDKTGYPLTDIAEPMYAQMLNNGTITGVFPPTYTTFSEDADTERASIENDLSTYAAEQEAAFVFGQRDLSEWDAFLAELESIADVDELLALYDEAETVVRDPRRIYIVE